MNSPMHLLSPIDRLRAALTDAARAERTVLISLAAYWVLWTIYGTIANQTGHSLEGIVIVMVSYLILSWAISAAVDFVDRRMSKRGASR